MTRPDPTPHSPWGAILVMCIVAALVVWVLILGGGS